MPASSWNLANPIGSGKRMDEYREHRSATQPGAAQNAGSVFKNPPGTSAGRLVEDAGLKGFRVGNATVSGLHANFMIAADGATAQDVYDLVQSVRRKVLASSGIELEPEDPLCRIVRGPHRRGIPMTDSIRTMRTDPRITRRRKAIERSREEEARAEPFVRRCRPGTGVGGVLVAAAGRAPGAGVGLEARDGSRHRARAAHIGSGTNLLLLSTSRVVDAAESLPWVRRARVARSLPGTVRVRIVERRPVFVLRQGSSRWLLDSSGYVIAPATHGHHHLPTLAGVKPSSIRPGVRLTTETGAGALAAWPALPRKLVHRVVAVFAPTVDAITFSLKNGTTVRYGPPTDMRDKNQVLLALLHKISVEGTGTSYIDVRVPTSPAVGPPATQGGGGPTPADTASPLPTASSSPSPKASPSPKSSPTATP